MDDAFRTRVEASVANALLERIKKAEDADAALEDLERIRRFANAGFGPRLVAALGMLRNAEFLDSDKRQEIEAEWRKLGGQSVASERREIDTRSATASPPDGQHTSGMIALPVSTYGADPGSPWRDVEGDALAGFLEQINPIDGRHTVDATTTRVAWRPLSFYEECALLRVVDTTWSKLGLAIFYLTLNGNLYRLKGTSPPIHEVNARAPIKLDEQNVLDYLRFFTFFVWGEEGPFYSAESMEDPILPDFPDEGARAAVAGQLRPLEFTGRDDRDNYVCNGIIYYANALFRANFAVQSTGMIEMLDDVPLLGDLPVRIEAPIS